MIKCPNCQVNPGELHERGCEMAIDVETGGKAVDAVFEDEYHWNPDIWKGTFMNKARWTFYFKNEENDFFEYSYTDWFDDGGDMHGIWYEPFTDTDDKFYIFNLLKIARLHNQGTVNEPLVSLLRMIGDPYKVSVQLA